MDFRIRKPRILSLSFGRYTVEAGSISLIIALYLILGSKTAGVVGVETLRVKEKASASSSQYLVTGWH